MSVDEKQLDALVEAVLSSSKYATIAPDLVRAIGQRELTIRSSTKAAVKATKSKLHQVGGAYHTTQLDYAEALQLLRESQSDETAFRAACRQVMKAHSSTRERLPILEEFFTRTLRDIGPVSRVLDIACGLNPLAWPWMPFDAGVHYMAYDIYADQIGFLETFMNLAGIQGGAQVRDVVHEPPRAPADLILLLKTLPCLEQLEKGAAQGLLDALQGHYLLISYPVASLGGRKKGMVANYEAQFWALAAGRSWRVERYEFATELAFLVETEPVNG